MEEFIGIERDDFIKPFPFKSEVLSSAADVGLVEFQFLQFLEIRAYFVGDLYLLLISVRLYAFYCVISFELVELFFSFREDLFDFLLLSPDDPIPHIC